MKYSHAVAHLGLMWGLEEEHIEKLKKLKRKSKAVKERIKEGEYYLEEMVSAMRVLLDKK